MISGTIWFIVGVAVVYVVALGACVGAILFRWRRDR